MSSSATNAYIRQVLHHVEPPPAIDARFFYTSPIPIDDPLSALPPASGAGAAASKLPPKPFSVYDNRALDASWQALRRKILKHNEDRGEKGTVPGQRRTSKARRPSSVINRDKGPTSPKSGTPNVKPVRYSSSGLSQHVERAEDDNDDVDSDAEGFGVSNAASLATAESRTSGTPFIRAPSKKKVETISERDERKPRPRIKQHDTYIWDDPSHLAEHSPAPQPEPEAESLPKDTVAVGVSRLHQVEMPSLQMVPIYWTPVNDTAQVIRGTWFYQDSMLPVEASVANMLEAGYLELKVWTETWRDELNSAVEHGALGEMKILHKLWPELPPAAKRGESSSRPSSQRGTLNQEENLLRAATATFFEIEPETPDQQRAKIVETACDIIDVSTGPDGADNKASGESSYGLNGVPKIYSSCGVIYQNDREARLLKPAHFPSSYYGRRPLANYIRKGHKLGIPVIRGFDQQAWDKLHPSKNTPKDTQAARGVTTSASGVEPESRRQQDAELALSDRPKVTDLIFVIHGIGQKLSQRMESFHFTHAINAFRREVQLECGSKDVKPSFRKDMGGIMVLPINWRQSLTFEEGGYRPDAPGGTNSNLNQDEFTLDDITPDTLPSVRGIVSDVMLDVPYYMSQHQPKMIAAVMREANRVYSLWCQNNPGFAEHGRVHIIAHSLGSVMAIDILSKQPTEVEPLKSDESSQQVSTTTVGDDGSDQTKEDPAPEIGHLLFNTHNLFLAGSPAGFFLLLRRAQLRPRLRATSPKLPDNDKIYGQPGAYGCIAVHNVYNLMNGYDPVSYAMNAAVDVRYAASLKKFFLPTNVPGYWFSPVGSTGPGTPSTSASTSTGWFGGRPSLATMRSARGLELQHHETMAVARERMLALNDNGQIDYFIRYGGGLLEIQYLTMLGAHSAYWGLKDFIRVIVMETGRKPGVEGALGGLRAVRKKEKESKK